jgi:hypothetical protein
VDASFAGMLGSKGNQYQSWVKRWAGLLIFIQGCPVVWKSKLQTGVAMPAIESKYKGLSTSMQHVLQQKN